MITAFQKSAFQNNAYQIDVTVVRPVGAPQSFFSAKPKRWWEELLEEYQLAYDAEDRKKASKAKPAVKARKQVKRLAEEAVETGLIIDDGHAAVAAQLIAALDHAKRLDEALAYARQFKAYIEMLREQDLEQDEEDILLLL